MKVRRTATIVLAACAAAGLLVAAPLAGARTERKLTAFNLSFVGVYKHGKPVKVKNFVYSSIPLVCDEDTTAYSPSEKFEPMRVNDERRFRGTLKVDGITSKVVGRYKRDLSKVTGTLRARGSFDTFTGCDSGEVRWVTN
jgi:hypothetical protein